MIALTAAVQAAPPPVRAVKQRAQHCGVASAETILRAYGEGQAWTKQNKLAAALCARLPDYKRRHSRAADAKERYYPQFPETYQSELAELLIDRGYCVLNTRVSIDSETKRPMRRVWEMLRDHLEQGHLAVIHVPGHYMTATGVNLKRKVLYYVDPYRTKERFSTSFEAFRKGEPFHAKRSGDLRPGWDGRVLIFWKGEPINLRDRCPVCGNISKGERWAFCRTCRCFIDRRKNHRVQRALDVISDCIVRDEITRLHKPALRKKLQDLLHTGKLREQDIKQALLHYPVVGDQEDRLMTLHRYAETKAVDLDGLSLNVLVDIICAQELWQKALQDRLEEVQPGG